MIETLLSLSLSCSDANTVMQRIEKNDNLRKFLKTELIETIKDSTPECKWDAND